MKPIILILAAITLFFLLLSLWVFYHSIRPYRIFSSVTPADFGLTYENISFRTQDNIDIKGWFIPAKKPQAKTLILLHGYPADKGDILPSRVFLHDAYNLLFFDFRYHGESGGRYTSIGKNEVLDLLAAIQYLKTKNINEVGVWGLSMGGAVALMAATETKAIKAIVAEASYAQLDWMINHPFIQLTSLWARLFLGINISTVSPITSASKLAIPILLIHARDDQVIPFSHAEALQKALKNNPQSSVYFMDEGMHGQSSQEEHQIIKAFFDKYL